MFALPYYAFSIGAAFAAALLFPLLGWSAEPADPPQPLKVVVTLPVLKDWAQRIGGPHVAVTSLMTGYENEHTYSPKPSDLVAVRRARLLIEIGAGLEVWVSTLVRNAGNTALTTITLADGLDLIEDHDEAHARGTVPGAHAHRHGNPHVWLDPHGASAMVRRISEAFAETDPAHQEQYQANAAAYLDQLARLSEELHRRLQSATERRIVVHHPAWPYFARYFELAIAGTLLTQPGAEPSARRIQTLVERIKREGIRVIVSEAQLNQKLPRMVARETGAQVVLLTTLPGALPGTESYLDMLRYNVLQLAEALEKPSAIGSRP